MEKLFSASYRGWKRLLFHHLWIVILQSASNYKLICINLQAHLRHFSVRFASFWTLIWRRLQRFLPWFYAVSCLVFHNILIVNALQTGSKLAYFRPVMRLLLSMGCLAKGFVKENNKNPPPAPPQGRGVLTCITSPNPSQGGESRLAGPPPAPPKEGSLNLQGN